MAKKLKQSHFSFYLQNRPLKFCPEGHVPPSLKNSSGNRGLRAKIAIGANGLIFNKMLFTFTAYHHTLFHT